MEDMNHMNFPSLAAIGLHFILSGGNAVIKDLLLLLTFRTLRA